MINWRTDIVNMPKDGREVLVYTVFKCCDVVTYEEQADGVGVWYGVEMIRPRTVFKYWAEITEPEDR